MTRKTWTLTRADGQEETFIDIRKKVGNQIVRAYLLERITASGAIDRMKATLKGPKSEFKDFDRYLILSVQNGLDSYRILAQAKVYENLRIVATDNEAVSEGNPEDIIKLFTEPLEDPASYDARLVISETSVVIE